MTDNKPAEQNKIYPSQEGDLDNLAIASSRLTPGNEEFGIIPEQEAGAKVELPEQQKSHRVKKYITRATLGLLAVGGGVALATHPDHILKEAEKAAPVTIPGVIVSEGLWDLGLGMMVASAGKNVGNPLTLHKRWGEVSDQALNSSLTRVGLTINTIGAFATTGFIVYGGTKLSPDLWPGVAGFAGLDFASTVALRAPLVVAMKNSSDRLSNSSDPDAKPEKIKKPSIKVRHATLNDIDRLADIDLELFRKAYGEDIPPHEEVTTMLKKRYLNNPDWMFVSEVDGQVEGFVSAFRTNVASENFESWEKSTANGTLDDKVDPDGKYIYVTNMTIKSDAVRLGAEGMLLANLFANGIEAGVEYAYFISRVPYFKHWLKKKGLELTDGDELQRIAEEYVNMRRRDGSRRDPELRIYEKLGYSLERTVPEAFQDEASLNFGVICKVDAPKNKLMTIKPARLAYAAALRRVAKHPKLLGKVI